MSNVLMPPAGWDTVRDGPWNPKPAHASAPAEKKAAPELSRSVPCYYDVGMNQPQYDGTRPGDDPASGATKKDNGKEDLFTLFLDYFPNAIAAVTSVSEYGSRKYVKKGYLNVPDGFNRYSNADLRHLKLECTEGLYDENDSGLPHAAQHAWNALARLELALRAGSIENRRGNELSDGKPVLGTARRV